MLFFLQVHPWYPWQMGDFAYGITNIGWQWNLFWNLKFLSMCIYALKKKSYKAK